MPPDGRRSMRVSVLAVAGSVAYVFAGTLAALRYTGEADLALFDLPFLFGSLIETIASDRGFAACAAQSCPAAHRMPVLPLFFAALAATTDASVFTATLVKNLVFVVPALLGLVAAAARMRQVHWSIRLALVALVVGNPRWVLHTMLPVPEEGVLNALFACAAYLLLWERGKGAAGAMAAIVSLIVLTKSGLWLAGIALVVASCMRFGVRRGGMVGAVLACSVLAWSSHVASTGGPWLPVTSLDGWNLHKGNNSRVLEVYPARSLDELTPWLAALTPPEAQSDEWSQHRFHTDQARAFVTAHPWEALRGVVVKAYVFFGRLESPSGQGPALVLGWLSVPFMLGFRLLVVALGVWCVLRIRQAPRSPGPWLGIGLGLAYVAPYLVGFAYERHALVLLAPSVLAALYLIDRRTPELRRRND